MKKLMIKYLKLGIAILLITACSNNKYDVQTFEVNRGAFYIDIVETGELKATKSVNISSPALAWHFGMLKITHIVEDGTEIEKGDTVVHFDPSEIYKAKIDANAELEIAKAELSKLRAEQRSKIQELKSNLEINKLSFRIAEIQLEQADFESEVTKKEIQLNLDKTSISLDKAKEEIENQKKIHKEEIKQAQLKISQLQNRLQDANETIKKMTVTSPGDGIAIIGKNWSTQSKWQVGDQPWSGTPLILLPDLNEIMVDVEINEVDIAKIKPGQLSEIKLDAFTKTTFKAKVTSVATLAIFKDEEKSKIKVFPVSVVLEKATKDLMPGMTVSCRIIVDKIEDVLFIPAEAVHKIESSSFVYLKKGGSYKKKEVKTGLINDDYIIVEEGLEDGDEVALTVPEKYQDNA